MDCATEENEVRQALAGVAGIRELRFQLASRTLAIRADSAALLEAEMILRRLGYPPLLLDPGQPLPPVASAVPWFRLIAALVLAASAEAIPLLLSASWLQNAIEMSLALAAISLAGLPVYIKGLAALGQGRLNINALMTVAVSGAFLIGHWPEAGMVMALYALAEPLEARAADRARSAISQLMQLAPEQALVEHPSGQWHRMDVAAVAVGQAVRVEPGERIPLDGVVASGASAVTRPRSPARASRWRKAPVMLCSPAATPPWRWASKPCFCCSPCWARPRCGRPCSPTWAPACW